MSRPTVHAAARPTPPFGGYPYLVARIGRTALRHITVVPADWPRDRLIDLAHRQARINRLETCLCLGPADAVYITPDGNMGATSLVPRGIPVTDRLVLAGMIRDAPEQARRRDALRAYVDRWRPSGFLVGDGLEGGRPASAEDAARLSGRDSTGMPRGLRRCDACGEAFGEYLALGGEGSGDPTARVLDVHCRCDNPNRCAGCAAPLADHRLSAYHWDDARATVLYLAAYCGLSHRCVPPRVRPFGAPGHADDRLVPARVLGPGGRPAAFPARES